MATSKILNPYIAVEMKDQGIGCLRNGLREALRSLSVGAEDSSNSVHLSVAYGQGEADLDRLETVAQLIATRPFEVKVGGFEILEGITTPYDYLALTVESQGCFEDAVKAVEGRIETRRFGGGFKCHISLIRFEKGRLSSEVAHEIVRELNASQGAAQALGRAICLKGDCVRVYDLARQCRCDVQFAA